KSGVPSGSLGMGPLGTTGRRFEPPPAGEVGSAGAFPSRGRGACDSTNSGKLSPSIRESRKRFLTVILLFFYRVLSGGTASPPVVLANTLRPLASVSSRALAILEPSLAADPCTVTSSPTLSALLVQPFRCSAFGLASSIFQFVRAPSAPDRKSTRLNSSHEWISYAVFCLKKKKKIKMKTKENSREQT